MKKSLFHQVNQNRLQDAAVIKILNIIFISVLLVASEEAFHHCQCRGTAAGSGSQHFP
jgi:hypothetical protein